MGEQEKAVAIMVWVQAHASAIATKRPSLPIAALWVKGFMGFVGLLFLVALRAFGS